MNAELTKALLMGTLVSALLVWCGMVARREPSLGARLQLMGAVCGLAVVVAHVGEAQNVPSWMGWGRPTSVGHYVDLASAACTVGFLVAGYGLRRWQQRRLTGE